MPPRARTSSWPEEAAGSLSGTAWTMAPLSTSVMRLTVAVREFTGAGWTGLTMLPLGRTALTGLKQPELLMMSEPVTARTM